MKKILLLSVLVPAYMTANACGCLGGVDKRYEDWGKLQLIDNQLSSSKTGSTVQLRGWSTQSLHSDDVQGCLGMEQWKLMQEYGANVVRLAMYVDAPKSYLGNEAKYKEFIKTSIEETSKLGMYCIVDWHNTADTLSNGDPNDYINESKDFFEEISKYCADSAYGHVLYEICNEANCGWTNIKSYAENVIPVIVANQPDAIVIVGTDQWCQKIVEPVTNPIDSLYKKNVMYSFHYDACSHYYLLGEFRNAQKKIPVFVSEWSAANFDGEGPLCTDNSNELIANCDKRNDAPQVVSWCVENWGKKGDATSFFTGSCSSNNVSQYSDSGVRYGDYVLGLLGYCPPDTSDKHGHSDTLMAYNKISSTGASLWHWDYFDLGGEGNAYHDVNGGAWEIDSNGVVLNYKKDGEEVDVFSLAVEMAWLDKPCPWSTVENGKVVDFDSTISTFWKDEKGNPTYKSLNAGRHYFGTEVSARPDEGVDLLYANCRGTEYENLGYSGLGWVEAGEWINYTVNVEKPGFYKVSGLINGEYMSPKYDGEISIRSSFGNHLRVPDRLWDNEYITTFGFLPASECDKSVEPYEPWNCWSILDAKSGKEKQVLCLFPEAGEQSITIEFHANIIGGFGPLIFEWYADSGLPDSVCCYDPSMVENVDATAFSICPNPTTGEFTITLAENAEAIVDVVNMAGQVVVSQNIVGSATINKALTSGVYTVVVKSNGGVSTQKLVVK